MVRLFLLMGCCLAAVAQPWQPLFDGKSTEGWKDTAFERQVKSRLEEGAIVLGPGAPLSGITRGEPLKVRSNYEVRYEARRVKGNDFFASLTFPVKDSFCTFVTGGWGGDIVGLSSIDGWDAADNETRSYFTFDNGRWYAFRVQVTDDRIRAWIDEKGVVDVAIEGRTISLRPGETNKTVPLGLMAYSTVGAIRKIEYRTLPAKP